MNNRENKIILMNILGGMNSYIENLGDEEIIELWRMNGIQDEATEEDLADIVKNLDLVQGIMYSFIRRLSNQVEKSNGEDE